MRKHSIFIAWAAAAALAGSLTLAACGGNSSTTTTSNSNPSGSSPAVVSVGDAPSSSIMAALVTISDVSLTPASGSPIHLLAQSRTIELTHLGGIRAPLDLHSVPEGTYTSLSLTVSAATITWLGSNNQPVTAQATIGSPATATITLNPSLVVDDTTATDIRFDFDLASSINITGASSVTFTPTLSAAVARVKNEGQGDRVIYLNGTVTGTSTANNTITIQQSDTGLSVTLNVTSNTQFDNNLTLGSIQTGDVLHTIDLLNSDGTLTALAIEDVNGQGQGIGNGERADNGVVMSTTLDSGGNLTGFTVFVRESSNEQNEGKTLTVEKPSSGWEFKITKDATNAGMSTWDQTQIFPGAGVWLAGAIDTTAASPSVVAGAIRPAADYPFGLVSAAVTGTAPNFSIPLLLDSNDLFAHLGGVTALTLITNSNTAYDGSILTSANVATALTVSTPLVARGYLTMSGGVYSLFTAHVRDEANH